MELGTIKTVFPTLFQKTNGGAIQQWRIWVQDLPLAGPVGAIKGGVIYVEHGQVDGKMQQTHDVISEGKNTGKANATSPLDQALKEAKAKWVKQKKKGYVESIDDARAEKVDALIEGGIEPMLAPNKSYPKDDELVKRITYPCFFQPKLDGMRCIAIIENGTCTLWSRTRKRINTVPHIVEDLEHAFAGVETRVVLDGELYNHEYKDRFEDLMSVLRGDEPDEEGEYKNAEFHVYDCLEQSLMETPTNVASPFVARNAAIDDIFNLFICADSSIRRVVTVEVGSFEELKELYEQALRDGYEGGMARNKTAPYEVGKRSKHLQKMKEFIDGEFLIFSAEEGRGKDAGTVGAFVCFTVERREFRCRLKATYKRRRELFENPAQWTGKKLTITFKRWTADQVPYLPIGKGIRDYE